MTPLVATLIVLGVFAWGVAVGAVLMYLTAAKYARDLHERVAVLETRERESRVVISDAAIAAVNQRIFDDLFGDDDSEDAVIH
jgi:hypothetical protein